MMSKPYIASLIGELTRAIHDEISEGLRPLGLSLAQYRALWLIGETPGITNAEMARRARMTAQSMGSVVSGLETEGLLQRAVDPENARILPATLTADGVQALSRANEAIVALERRMVHGTTAADRERVESVLRDYIDRVRATAASADHRGTAR